MGRRGKKGGPMGGKWNISHSLQMRLALGYSCLIAVLLVLMNTYPLIMGQNLMFRSQQTALANQLVLITNTLTTADELTPETVEQAIGQLEELEVRRVLVTDGAGRVLYDTGEPSALGKYALIGEVVSALRGNDAFSSEYQDGAFSSRAASPVMNRNQVVGAVCLYDQDSDQGALLEELQRNLRLISVVVCLAVLVLFGAFSTFLSRRVRTLLGGIRTVRAGEYTHRISMDGHDELAQLAEEFNQLTGRLQVTEEERRRFVSDASHELKTPLALIQGYAEGLDSLDVDETTRQHYCKVIHSETMKMDHLVKDLLNLSRLETGTFRIDMTEFDFRALVEEAHCRFEGVMQEKDIQFSCCLPEEMVVYADPERIDTVLSNFLSNAIDYTEKGRRIVLSAVRSGDYYTISIYNQGIQIPEQDLSRVWEPFYKVDAARTRKSQRIFGGHGLGLGIVAALLKLHHETYGVYNEPDGVTFWFTLKAC